MAGARIFSRELPACNSFPEHYDIGCHITGTAGVFGAAAAIGKLLDLDGERMAWVLGLAASQPVGLREMFGSILAAPRGTA
jgi:2-methylcitrate dehydratase PrpD